MSMPMDGGPSDDDQIVALRAEVDQLKEAVTSHAVVDQAIGMMVALGRVTPDQGWEVLKEVSQHANIKLRNIAEMILIWDATAKCLRHPCRTGGRAGPPRTHPDPGWRTGHRALFLTGVFQPRPCGDTGEQGTLGNRSREGSAVSPPLSRPAVKDLPGRLGCVRGSSAGIGEQLLVGRFVGEFEFFAHACAAGVEQPGDVHLGDAELPGDPVCVIPPKNRR